MMQRVATLIGSLENQITEQQLNQLIEIISHEGAVITRHAWLCEGEAADVFFAGGSDALPHILNAWALENSVDVIVQAAEGRRKKALLADMESTLIKEEMLEELADFVGLRTKVEEITTRAMNGELDFRAALQERMLLLKGLPATILDDLCKKITITAGAHELVATMRAHGARCIIVSGGFTVFTSYVAQQLGFDADFGNGIDIQDGKITGAIVEPLLDRESKRRILGETAIAMNIAEADICAVGDGANDVPMLLAAGLGIAYHAKPNVQKQATFNIRFANLRALLWAQGYSANMIVK